MNRGTHPHTSAAKLGGLLLLALLSSAGAQAQISELGAAANFAGLILNCDSTFTISKDTTVVNGNAGVVDDGTLNFSGGAVITGTIYAGSGADLEISGGSGATGGIVENYSNMDTIVSDADNAAAYYSGLTATQTFASGIDSAATITGGSGVNVIDIDSGIDLSQANLTISGNASSQFVINVSGGIDLSRSNIELSGISADQVVFNLTGTGTVLTTTGDSDTSGVFLAENGAINISGGTHDSEFIAGGDLTWQSGVNITQADTGSLSPVPELGPWLTAVLALGAVAAVGIASRRNARLATLPVA